MLKALQQCPPGKVSAAGTSPEEEEADNKKPVFDASNDRPMMAKISRASLTQSHLPPVTDELTKQQQEDAMSKQQSKICSGSICPTLSSKRSASAYEQPSAIAAAQAADISRMIPLAGAHNRIGGKREALSLLYLVEDGVWPEYTLHETGSWAAHRKVLPLEQRHARPRPCIRATIHKTEVRGPKTSPFVVYVLHVRTAFTVRGIARRYSHFVELDADLRAHFKEMDVQGKLPLLPAKRFLGQLSVEFVQERRRLLQEYLDRVMSHASYAHSQPVLAFLNVLPDTSEDRIVREAGADHGPLLWDMPAGAPTDGIEEVIKELRGRGDLRQEARALNCLALMHAEAAAAASSSSSWRYPTGDRAGGLWRERAEAALTRAMVLCREGLEAVVKRRAAAAAAAPAAAAPRRNRKQVGGRLAVRNGFVEGGGAGGGGVGGGRDGGEVAEAEEEEEEEEEGGEEEEEKEDDDDEEEEEEADFWATGLMTCIGNLACVELRFGEEQTALQRLRDAVEIAGERGDVHGQAKSMGKIALVLASRGDLTGAIKVGRGAVEMLATSKSDARQAALCYAMASVYLSLGELRLAVEALESSLVLRRRARDKVFHTPSTPSNPPPSARFAPRLARCLRWLRCVLTRACSLSLSTRTPSVSLSLRGGGVGGRLYGWTCMQVGLAEALYKLGVCFLEIGYAPQALDHLQQSLALSQELGDSLGQALALAQLAALYLAHAEATRALAVYDEALHLFLHRGHVRGQVQYLCLCVCVSPPPPSSSSLSPLSASCGGSAGWGWLTRSDGGGADAACFFDSGHVPCGHEQGAAAAGRWVDSRDALQGGVATAARGRPHPRRPCCSHALAARLAAGPAPDPGPRCLLLLPSLESSPLFALAQGFGALLACFLARPLSGSLAARRHAASVRWHARRLYSSLLHGYP
jgi:tetratricopeptide (TPR) repeat protein